MKLFSFHAGQIVRNCRWPKWYKLKLQGLLIHNSSQVTSRREFLSFPYLMCSINVCLINGLVDGYYSDFLLCSQSTLVPLAYSCQQRVAILNFSQGLPSTLGNCHRSQVCINVPTTKVATETKKHWEIMALNPDWSQWKRSPCRRAWCTGKRIVGKLGWQCEGLKEQSRTSCEYVPLNWSTNFKLL